MNLIAFSRTRISLFLAFYARCAFSKCTISIDMPVNNDSSTFSISSPGTTVTPYVDNMVKKDERISISLDEFPMDCIAAQELSVIISNKSIMFSVKVGKELALTNADDTESSTNDRRANNMYIFADHANGSAINIIRKSSGQMIGSIIDVEQGVVMQIRIDSEGNNFVHVTPSSDFPPEADPIDESPPPPPASINEMTNQRDLSQSSSKGVTGGSATHDTVQRNTNETPITIDVMVLWTKKAECANAGFSSNCSVNVSTAEQMEDLIQLAIQETNTAYQLSGVDIQLQLVHSYRSNYVEPSSNAFSTSLDDLKIQTDGEMDEVHSLRDTYGADVVALIIDDPAYCGIGFIGPRSDLMFSVTKWSCATGYFSFGHEIGHNIGLLHDRGTSNACGSSGYKYGYRDPEGSFRTIMAYSCRTDQCDKNARSSCTRIQRFSTPNVTFSNKPLGTSSNDAARWLNERASEVANYYERKPQCTSPDDCTAYIGDPCYVATCDIICTYTDICKFPSDGICGENRSWLQIDITTDDYPAETSWTLTNECSGEVLIDMKGNVGDQILGTEEFNRRIGDRRAYICVDEQEYTFTINDTYGDGICCGYGAGKYSIEYEGMIQSPTIGGSFEFTESQTLKIGECPTARPSNHPSVKPSSRPTADPSITPTQTPTLLPTVLPSFHPSIEPTQMPTLLPTTLPSLHPSIKPSLSISPSYHPSASLIPSASPTKAPTGNPSGVPSSSPSKHPTASPSNAPSISQKPSASSEPTVIPSTLPSVIPTSYPSAYPTNKASSSPSASPTALPSTAPSEHPTFPCIDDTSFTFRLDNDNIQNCEWLTKNAEKTEDRIAAYCTRGHVKGGCQQSCDYCPCEDEGGYRFKPDNETEQDCAWLTLNESSIDANRQNYCYGEDGVSASDVGNACVYSCGFCFVPPTRSPTAAPTEDPTSKPSSIPSREPSAEPSMIPLASPSAVPSMSPTTTTKPSSIPSKSQSPSYFPSISMLPSTSPSVAPTRNPSGFPSFFPSKDPTATPTNIPSSLPSDRPTEHPSVWPTGEPTLNPSDIPSNAPTASPSILPTGTPSNVPSERPTVAPIVQPSTSPSLRPSAVPSHAPSDLPSQGPSMSAYPSSRPSLIPSIDPTGSPSSIPSYEPSAVPSSRPSTSSEPSVTPSALPSVSPTSYPSAYPTNKPSSFPSDKPSLGPSDVPSITPSDAPSTVPSDVPSIKASGSPTALPSTAPSEHPTFPCIDDTSFTFRLDNDNIQNCEWLTKNAERIEDRIAAYCTRGHVKGGCQQSCDYCPCEDEGGYRFKPDNETEQDCAWLTLNESSIDANRQNYCYGEDGVSASDVGNACVYSCGFCFVPPTRSPTAAPTEDPTSKPSSIPSREPSAEPSMIPLASPSAVPSMSPTTTTKPSSIPSKSQSPSYFPSISMLPSTSPSVAPTRNPSGLPSFFPSKDPTATPTNIPSSLPSDRPTEHPSVWPTGEPTLNPSDIPSNAPTVSPSILPSGTPSNVPSERPTVAPIVQPSSSPSQHPSAVPSRAPSDLPSQGPSMSAYPSSRPSLIPSIDPTGSPSSVPTYEPTAVPSSSPSTSSEPSVTPSALPSVDPTSYPSAYPTNIPSSYPSDKPSLGPSDVPTITPSDAPSTAPSDVPSIKPSGSPTALPSTAPSEHPTFPCIDDTSFTFRLDNDNIQNCEWLTKNAERTEDRIAAYCTRGHVKGGCQQSCDYCPCEDESGYRFKPDNETEQDCTWLTLNESFIDANRQNYCYGEDGVSASDVGNACVYSCGFCFVPPTRSPTAAPTEDPTSKPSTIPSREPSAEPSMIPLASPSAVPSMSPTTTTKPSSNPSKSQSPSYFPSISMLPSTSPSVAPTRNPSGLPSFFPSKDPTATPTNIPSSLPSDRPTEHPSVWPTGEPTLNPSDIPSNAPTVSPSILPSGTPSNVPSERPTVAPIVQPSSSPSQHPSAVPSRAPSDLPSQGPSMSAYPSSRPSLIPSIDPTGSPSSVPTYEPSAVPSSSPSTSSEPSMIPSTLPSIDPTSYPSAYPTNIPSSFPSDKPSLGPSDVPTITPSDAPSTAPSNVPSIKPSDSPTPLPSTPPSEHPTFHCIDDTSFTFRLDNDNIQNCEWLTKNAEKTEARIDAYCTRGHVKGGCQQSCDFCPCEDESGYTFMLDIGTEQDCEWLVRNQDRIDVRRQNYCYGEDGVSASDVGNACVSSCGFCL